MNSYTEYCKNHIYINIKTYKAANFMEPRLFYNNRTFLTSVCEAVVTSAHVVICTIVSESEQRPLI